MNIHLQRSKADVHAIEEGYEETCNQKWKQPPFDLTHYVKLKGRERRQWRTFCGRHVCFHCRRRFRCKLGDSLDTGCDLLGVEDSLPVWPHQGRHAELDGLIASIGKRAFPFFEDDGGKHVDMPE